MAAGDAKLDSQNIASAGFLDIRPAAGENWVLTNIFYSGQIEVYFYNGATDIGPIATDDSVGAMLGLNIHMDNTHRVRVKAISAARQIGYAAVQTK